MPEKGWNRTINGVRIVIMVSKLKPHENLKQLFFYFFYFYVDKKQYIDQKRIKRFQVINREYPRRNQMETKKTARRSSCKKTYLPQQKPATLPIPYPSQKVHQRIRIINAILICPIPQIAQEVRFCSLSGSDLVFKHHPIFSRHKVHNRHKGAVT